MPSFLLSPGICREENSHGPAYTPASPNNQTDESLLANEKNMKDNNRVLEERGRGEEADILGYWRRGSKEVTLELRLQG